MRRPKDQAGIRHIRFDREDAHLLLTIAKAEKLTVSDVIRRAVRAFAKTLGLTTEVPK